jgi:preprotein translocase subunit SecG
MIVLSIHLVVCIALIGLVLLQRSEGGALGMGGGGAGALMSGRGAADALAKMTQVAGGFFLITSLALTLLSGAASSEGRSVLDMLPRNAPVTLPASPPPTHTPTPTQPTAPDPTQSSAPQAAQSQLAAAVIPGPSSAQAATPQVAPPSTTAGSRAAPLQVRPTQNQTAAAPLQTATPNRGAATLASTSAHPATRTTTPAVTTQRSGVATNQAGAQPRLILPTSPGAQALSDGQTAPESSDAVQPVRRQRAGPDQ